MSGFNFIFCLFQILQNEHSLKKCMILCAFIMKPLYLFCHEAQTHILQKHINYWALEVKNRGNHEHFALKSFLRNSVLTKSIFKNWIPHTLGSDMHIEIIDSRWDVGSWRDKGLIPRRCCCSPKRNLIQQRCLAWWQEFSLQKYFPFFNQRLIQKKLQMPVMVLSILNLSPSPSSLPISILTAFLGFANGKEKKLEVVKFFVKLSPILLIL